MMIKMMQGTVLSQSISRIATVNATVASRILGCGRVAGKSSVVLAFSARHAAACASLSTLPSNVPLHERHDSSVSLPPVSPCDPSTTKPPSCVSFASGVSSLSSSAAALPASFASSIEEQHPYPPATTTVTAPVSLPDFNDPSSAHANKSILELLRAMAVYRLCQIQLLVNHGEALLSLSRKVIGSTLTDAIVKHTFFHQFCAGEDEDNIRPTIHALREYGIGGILDYAAENEGDETDGKEEKKGLDQLTGGGIVTHPPYNQPARIYDYESEFNCDRHVDVFLSCIHAVRDVTPDGFAALKVTALGNPILLERMSLAISEAKKLFAKFDSDGDGVVSREDFEMGYGMCFVDADEKLPEMLDVLDPDGTGKVDYIAWSKLLSPSDLPRITASCREIGPLASATPSHEELELMEAMHRRAHTLAEEAFNCGTRLLIDAEQNKFQPAIDNLVLELQQKYNATEKTDIPIIFNTYQCYLKDTPQRMMIDVERSKRFSYHFAAKLVRGAYMESERDRAKEMGYPSPIHDSVEDTHRCYDESVEYLLRHKVASGANLEVMCATHNQKSIERTIELMNELGIDASEPTVHFAQLYGMSDNLTYPLGKHGFRAYKYVPYGKVDEVMPYLMRRAQENSAMLGNASKELRLLHGELKRRLTCV